MKSKLNPARAALLACALLLPFLSPFAQNLPGKIIRQAALPASNTVLDPVSPTGWTSKTTSGFAGDDVGNAKLGFKPIPTFSTEPFGDLRRGPNHLYSDFVPDAAGTGVYMHFDGTNLIFRMRMGNIVPGAKGYSVLVDTDLKFGNTGPNTDPNYLPATTGVNGNPGFEREIILATGGSNNGILVYNVDGNDNASALTPTSSFSGWTNYSQISIAGTNDNGDPDFFLDFCVPLTALGVSASTPLRFSATTVMSGQSAVGGPKSDIYGLNDGGYKSTNSQWESYINALPPIRPSDLAGPGTTPTSTGACTAVPVITSVTTTGGTNNKGVVTGTWTKLSTSSITSATITVYQNGTALTGTATATSGSTWTFNVPAAATLVPGQTITATALGSGETQCLTSNAYVLTACANWTASGLVAPIGGNTTQTNCMTTAGGFVTPKGVDGSNRNSATWTVFVSEAISNTSQNSSANAGTTGFSNNGSSSTWTASATGAWAYSSGCSGGANMSAGIYSFWYQDANGCKSDVTPMCVSGNGGSSLGGTVSVIPTLSPATVSANTTSITVTGAAGSAIILYANGEVVASGTINGTFNNTATGSITFNNLSLPANATLSALSRVVGANNAGSYCAAKSAVQTVALCATTPPVINADANGQTAAGQPITGFASEPAGTTIRVYTTTNPTTPIAVATVAADGSWTTGATTAIAGTLYYATAQNGSCGLSNASANVAAANATSSTLCTTINPASVNETTTSVTGNFATAPTATTTVNLYQDGVLTGTTSVAAGASTWTVSGIPVGTLFPGSVIAIGIRQGTNQETFCPGSAKTVVCATVPTSPTVSPANPTIRPGETVTFTLTGVTAGNFYGIVDANTGRTLSAGVWPATSGTITLTTYPFSGNSGTVYNIQVKTSSVSATAVCSGAAASNVTLSGFTLAAHFLTVSAAKSGSATAVNWTVTGEQDVAYYTVERSTDCQRFETVGRANYKPAHTNNNTYAFSDVASPTGRVCYRIVQVDVNGRTLYSQVVWVNAGGALAVQLMPNPATDHATVAINTTVDGGGTLTLLDATGQAVIKQQVRLQKGNNTVSLTGLRKFAPGHYLLVVITPEGQVQQKVLLQ